MDYIFLSQNRSNAIWNLVIVEEIHENISTLHLLIFRDLKSFSESWKYQQVHIDVELECIRPHLLNYAQLYLSTLWIVSFECQWVIKVRKLVIDCKLNFRTHKANHYVGKTLDHFFHFLLLFKIVLDIENEQYYYYQYYWQYSNHQFTDSEQIVTNFRSINELNIDSNAVWIGIKNGKHFGL